MRLTAKQAHARATECRQADVAYFTKNVEATETALGVIYDINHQRSRAEIDAGRAHAQELSEKLTALGAECKRLNDAFLADLEETGDVWEPETWNDGDLHPPRADDLWRGGDP